MERTFEFVFTARNAAALAAVTFVLGACQNAANPMLLAEPPPTAAPVFATAGAAAPMSTGAPTTAAAPLTAAPAAGGSAASAPVLPTATENPSAAVSGSAGSAAPGAVAATPVAPTSPPLKLSITIPQVPPGEEGTQCVQMHLTNTTPVNVIKIHNTLTSSSHHLIVTAVTDPAAPEKALAPCQTFRGAIAGAPLTITQAHDDLVLLPEGVGYHLNAGQVMNLELHYINTTDKAVDITGSSELFIAEPGAAIQDGAVLLVGTLDIDVPAHSTAQNGPKYLALPPGMDDVKFFAITGHTHRFGTNVTVSSASSATAPAEQLYAPLKYDWEAPEMKQLTPHVSVPSGGGFLLQCAWNNTSDAALKFGESATAEMCFFWGYYYPRKDVVSVVLDDIDPSVLKTL